jgi:hypothetical protein
MKKLLLLLLLSLGLIGCSITATEEVVVNTFTVDDDTIKKYDGYVYFQTMTDLLKPMNGNMSWRSYYQADCGVVRYKILSHIFYKQPMLQGSGESYTFPSPEWIYPLPDDDIVDYVCDYVD